MTDKKISELTALGETPASADLFAIVDSSGAITKYVTFANLLAPITVDGTDFQINTDKFTVAGATGNTVVAGTLGVTGLTSITATGAAAQAAFTVTDAGSSAIRIIGDTPTFSLKETDGSADENWQARVSAGSLLIQTQNDAFTSSSTKLTIDQNGAVSMADALGVTGLTNLAGNTVIGDISLTGDGTLHVHTGTAGAVTASSTADNLIVENSDHAGISILSPDNKVSVIYFGSPSDTVGASFEWDYDGDTNGLFTIGTAKANAQLRLYSGNATEAARIDASQRLLVGYTASQTAAGGFEGNLQVNGTGADAAVHINRFSAGSNPSKLIFSKSANGTIGSHTIVDDNEEIGDIAFAPSDGVDFANISVRLRAEVDDATPAADAIGGAFTISTATTAGVLTERFRIAADGLSTFTGNILVSKDGAAISVLDDSGPDTRMYSGDAEGSLGTFSNHPLSLRVNTTRALYIDTSLNVGIGNISLESWAAGYTALQVGGNASLMANTAPGASKNFYIGQNTYLDLTDARWEYQDTDEASLYHQASGVHTFYVAVSGTADDPISWIGGLNIGQTEVVVNDGGADRDFRVESDTITNALFVDGATGYIGINESSPDEMLHLTSATSANPVIQIENTNGDQYGGQLKFITVSGTPADDDSIGRIRFDGETDTSAAVNFGYVDFIAADVTNATRAGAISFEVLMNGTAARSLLRLDGYNGTANQGTITFNDDAQDVDTIIEAVGVATALKVQGSDGGVFMGALKSGATQVAAGAAAGELWVTASHATLPDNVVMIGA